MGQTVVNHPALLERHGAVTHAGNQPESSGLAIKTETPA